jgi:(p)ppGpp synthase/HD superfamily hydrolase
MLDTKGNELITASAVFAAEAHAGQVRKELNEPYIVHPLRVAKLAAQLGQSPEFIAAAHLHDVVEDTNMPFVAIERLFPEPTVVLVSAMTKRWQVGIPDLVVRANKQAYYEHILLTPGAPLLKVLDRIDNLYDFAKIARRATPSSHTWAKRYYDKTCAEFVPLLAELRHSGDDAYVTAVEWFNIAVSALAVTL